MSLVEVRQEIVDKLEELDEAMLQAIHTIVYNATQSVETGTFVDYDPHNGQPISEEELVEQLTEIDDKIANGTQKTIPAEEVYQKVEAWLSSSK